MTLAMDTKDPQIETAMQLLAARWTAAQPVVASFVASAISRHQDAEEVLQRTAVALVAKSEQYDPAQPFLNWAIGLARIEVLRLRQERQREKTTFDSETLETVAAAFERIGPELDDLRTALRHCVGKLGGKVREIFELHYVSHLSPDDIAQKLARSANSIFVALHRGRTAMRRCLERRIGASGGVA